eukprot:403373203
MSTTGGYEENQNALSNYGGNNSITQPPQHFISQAHNLQQLENYLHFYRHKLDAFEQERIEWQEQAEQMRLQIEKFHGSEQQILGKKNEITEIQKALSDSHISIYDERHQFMKLKREYDILLNQERDDLRRIKELNQYNNDIENNSDFANFKDCRPNATSQGNQNSSLFSNTTLAESNINHSNTHAGQSMKKQNTKTGKQQQTLAINKSQQLKDKTKKQLIDQHQKQASRVHNAATTFKDGQHTILKTIDRPNGTNGYSQSSQMSGGIIKTVIMPNEEINQLGIEAEELRQMLAAQKQLFEEAMGGYQKDRIIRDQEFKLKEQDFKEKLENFKIRLQQRQDVNYQLSKEYFAYKHVIGKTKQKLQDDYDLLKVENQALKQQLDKIIDHTSNDTSYSANLFTQKTHNFAQRFRKASKENEEDLNIVKIQYSQVQDKYLADLQNMESNLHMVVDKSKLLVNRRATENQAFQGDVLTLKKRVNQYERYIKTLKDLVDQEKTDDLLQILSQEDKVQLDDGSSVTLNQLAQEIARIEVEVRESKKYNINAAVKE